MLKFATVGSGWICEEYIRGALDSGLWELCAVYSRTWERGEAFAAKFGVERVFTDLTKMARCPEIDAVYVSSPNALHYEQCRVLLENGKHVICEKPLCAQSGKVQALQALAAEHGVIYLEAIMYQHLPQRKLLEEALGKIGQITLARLDFCQRSSKLDNYLAGGLPNIFNPQMETGALMDLGVYCVYPAVALFGKPESFSVEPFMLKSGVDGCDTVTLRYPDKLVLLTCSKLGQAGANSDFQGTEGTVAVDSISRLGGMRLWRKDGTVEEFYGGDEKYILMGWEAKDFYRFIIQPTETAEEYRRCGELSLAVAELLEAIRREAGIRFPSDD